MKELYNVCRQECENFGPAARIDPTTEECSERDYDCWECSEEEADKDGYMERYEEREVYDPETNRPVDTLSDEVNGSLALACGLSTLLLAGVLLCIVWSSGRIYQKQRKILKVKEDARQQQQQQQQMAVAMQYGMQVMQHQQMMQQQQQQMMMQQQQMMGWGNMNQVVIII